MAIDRIGKGGGPKVPESNEAGAPARAPSATRPFEVRTEKTAQAHAAHAATEVSPVASSPLERLRAGEIDVNRYVDLKVDEATAHLDGMRPAQLDAVKKMLRDQIATDPALVDLVKHAAGSAPSVTQGGDEE